MAILDKFKMDGKVVCVTGAGQGLGKVSAKGLAEAGADVVVADLDSDSGQRTADEISALGVKSISIPTDVANPESVDSLMEGILSEFGRLDAIFNNAGIAEGGNAEEMTLDVWQRTIDVNLTGVFLCAQAAGKIMLKQKSGSIINMASMSGKIINDTHNVCNYHAAKNGVVGLTRAMAAEWAPHNVRVNAISPGYHKSEMAMCFESLFEKWIPRIPMGRLAEVEEIQGLVLFLASDASTYMTGADLITDGGYTLW